MREINSIIVHCSATKHTAYSLDRDFIRKIHVEENGWSDIGYHWIIKRDGTVQRGRALARMGAHAAGHNETSIGICLMGGLHDNGLPSEGLHHFSIEQQLSLAYMVNETMKAFPAVTTIKGHRDLPGMSTWCPCFDVYWFLETLPAVVNKMGLSDYEPVLEQ